MTSTSQRTIYRDVRPQAWPARLKFYVNRPWEKLFGKPLFRLGVYEIFGQPPKWQQWWPRLMRWGRHDAYETNVPLALGLLALCVLIGLAWRTYAPTFFTDGWVEFIGLTYDIFFILVLFAFFDHRRQGWLDARRQQEIIDDYKKWNSEEAKFRIAGAIRRLVRAGKTNIDFGGIELRDFSFRGHDIKSIRGATFYDGTWGTSGRRDQVVLEDVDFTFVDCRQVTFSRFNPLSGLGVDVRFAWFKNCFFTEANLERAVFDGAYLEWTATHPEDLGTWQEDDNGQGHFLQNHYPAFHNAKLSGASFADVTFRNADFRQAEALLECNFGGAKGLETCLFDDERTKQAVLTMAQGQSAVRSGKERTSGLGGR